MRELQAKDSSEAFSISVYEVLKHSPMHGGEEAHTVVMAIDCRRLLFNILFHSGRSGYFGVNALVHELQNLHSVAGQRDVEALDDDEDFFLRMIVQSGQVVGNKASAIKIPLSDVCVEALFGKVIDTSLPANIAQMHRP